MHGDIFIYYKFLFYLLSLINDILKFWSDQITFLYPGYRPTHCITASISHYRHIQYDWVRSWMANEFFFAKINDFPRPSSRNEYSADFGPSKFTWTLDCCTPAYVNVAFLLDQDINVIVDIFRCVRSNIKLRSLWVRRSQTICYENNERVM